LRIVYKFVKISGFIRVISGTLFSGIDHADPGDEPGSRLGVESALGHRGQIDRTDIFAFTSLT